ncbi:hypothetical protein Chor_017078 [Crotalus horridus]
MSLKAVSLHNIPGGTPVKDFVNFQVNCTFDSAKIPPSMVLTCQNVCSGKEIEGINVFQSTLVSDNMHTKELFDISEIKTSSEGILGLISSCQKTKPLTRSVIQKRKACESLPFESPAKIFSRMKQKAALVKEKNKPPEAKLLDSRCTADYILTPERQPAFLQRSEKIPIHEYKQKTKLGEDFLEESNVKTVTNSISVNKNICIALINSPFLESPNKFFSRVKQRLQEDWSQKAKQPLVTSCPTKKLNNFNEECLSTTVSQKEKIIVEPAELASETFTIISNPLIVSDDHINSREFLREEASRKFPQEKAMVTPSKNIYGQKAGENVSVSPQKPSQHLCDSIFATPKVHIPRKRRHDTKVLLDEPDTGTNKKNLRIISEIDMKDIFWHSNVIVERITHNQVKTLTGNIYMLEGYIDAVSMKKEGLKNGIRSTLLKHNNYPKAIPLFQTGIPPKFIKRFGTGIPRNWKMLVDDLLHYLKRKEERAFPVSGDSKKRKNECSEGLDLPQNIERKCKMKDTTYDVLPLQNEEIYDIQMKTIDLQNDVDKSITRSGRRVKPPMQFWCGERIRLDQELNVTITKGGKINMKSENITRKTECKLKEKSQHLISDTEENYSELIIKDICKKRATVMLTPLEKKRMQEKQHSNRRPRNELNVTKEGGHITCYERNLADGELDTFNCPLNLLKQHQQIEKVVGSVSCTDEDESSEDIPCIKRKTQHSFKREISHKECNNTQELSREQKSTENWIAPSRSRKTKCSYFGQEDTLEELSNKSSSPDLGTNSELRKRNRQKSSKWFKKARRNALASETESENSIEEIPVKESRIKIPTKKTNGHISTIPKACPVTGKPDNQKKLGNAVESFPDTNENWTEEELQKAVESFPKHKSDFWLDVAKTVRTRSAEECQQKYMAKQEGRKRPPNKTTKPGKKEERDRGTQQPLAKVGTLKRKQQMRNFLEQMPKDNHDDIFTSTPFQNKNTKFYVAPEEDVFQLKDRHPITPASAIFPWVKTPQCDHVSPGMLESLDRKNWEKHVFHMQNNIKGKERTWLNVKKKSAVTGFTTSMSPRTNVFTFEDATTSDGVRNLFEVEEGIQSDEEDDMYFST